MAELYNHKENHDFQNLFKRDLNSLVESADIILFGKLFQTGTTLFVKK